LARRPPLVAIARGVGRYFFVGLVVEERSVFFVVSEEVGESVASAFASQSIFGCGPIGSV
jgi:hypothetical protein